MDTIYNFKYSISEDNYLAYSIFAHENLNNLGWTKFMPYLFISAAFIGALLLGFFRVPDVPFLVVVPITSVLVYFITILYVASSYEAGLKKSMKKIIDKGFKLPFGRNVEVLCNDEGFISVDELAETRIKYTSVTQIAEGKDAVYVFFSALQAFIIPFSAFENEAQRNEFLAFLKGKSGIEN